MQAMHFKKMHIGEWFKSRNFIFIKEVKQDKQND